MSMYIEDETTESYKRDLRYSQTKTYSQVKTESHNVKISGDLINRGTVIEVLKQTGIIQDNDLGHLVVDEINRIPIAYDVEKVMEELEENSIVEMRFNGRPPIQNIDIERAIDIVRKGGVE